jgi:hypothetical protein
MVRGDVTNERGGAEGAAGGHPGVILYPYGVPSRADHAELCAQFVVDAGGDVRRVIDGPFPSLERFISFAEKLPALRESVIANQRPIVVLTRTSPVAISVVNARRKIESAVAGLRSAVWAVFVDPEQDPYFFDTLKSLGRLEGEAKDVPIWFDPDERPFLIVSPEVRQATRVRTAVRILFQD